MAITKGASGAARVRRRAMKAIEKRPRVPDCEWSLASEARGAQIDDDGRFRAIIARLLQWRRGPLLPK